jgi:hypothetical protein
MYQALVMELKQHLVDQGLTFNAEDALDPVVIRPMKADLLLTNLLDYMIGAGYASTTKTF